MFDRDELNLLALDIKLVGTRSKKSALLSAGKMADKLRLLPSVYTLLKLNFDVYATKGTSHFLNQLNVANTEIYKIAEHKEPNIRSFLEHDRFDLVVNVLTDDRDYDEASDSKLIRRLAIEHEIPLITDVDVAKLMIDKLEERVREGVYRYKLADKTTPWDMRIAFRRFVESHGGYCNYHAHFDKAYLISKDNLKLSMVDMQRKWALYKHLKENYTHEDLVERISRGVETMISQGAAYCRTMVDADSTVKTLPTQAALEVKKKYASRIHMEIGVQPLQGVLDEESRLYFEQACEMADLVGGLPSKDRPTPEKHLDVVLGLARKLGKRVDVHVDQENNPQETETELLAHKTMEYGLEGRVAAIHAISVAAKPPAEQDRIVRLMHKAGVSAIVCPSAALSMKQLEYTAPLHNSIAPVARMLDAGVRVRLGVDNVYDLFMPLVDGDMWFECRLLMEACRIYDLERIAQIACDRSGFAGEAVRV
jgi:adenosine deaminase